MRLTEAGRVFLDEARELLQRADDAIKRARDVAIGGTELHVGYSPTPTARLLPPNLTHVSACDANVSVRLHDWSNDENLAELSDSRLQLALVYVPTASRSAFRKLRFAELTQERVCLAVSPKHPFARRKIVSLEDAAREPFIGYIRDEFP